MELTNEVYCRAAGKSVRPEVRKEVLELLTLMLAPDDATLAEELWKCWDLRADYDGGLAGI